MVRSKIKPRSFTVSQTDRENNFFYRLILNQRFLSIIGLIILVLLALPLAKNYSQKKIIEQEIAELEANISKYENEATELQEMIKYLESDQSLETQARLNLNLKKPEEDVIVIEKNVINNSSTELAVTNEDNKNNLYKWFDYFFK